MSGAYVITKRIFDVVGAAAVVLLLSPLMVLLYLLVRLTSRGPGLFIQQRAGKGGANFPLLKFRTMRADLVPDPAPTIVITARDQAVTPVGRVLRRLRLDELPQLFNVLTGHMSLVGPRPTVPEQVAQYDAFKRRRLEVPPGITGLAQVSGGTGLTWDERIEWDVWYVDHRGPWLDLKILARTALTILLGSRRQLRRFADVHPEEAGNREPGTGRNSE
ncbi:MAG TPA: sugar transferase [Phycisphaerae bacterium]|nr:sugar transferase [Phycisphaerae bacterium]